MKIGLPQIIVIALYVLALGIELAEDGKPKTGTHSFVKTTIAVGVIFALLKWGGFFG